MDPLPPMPSNGQCVCGRAPFFQRSGVVGQPGHFHCRRCGRRYRSSEEGWTPGETPPESRNRAGLIAAALLFASNAKTTIARRSTSSTGKKATTKATH